MEKNPFFTPPSEDSHIAYNDLSMEAEDNPSSAENTLIYQSAENSPLDISGINPESAINTSESARNVNSSETKNSENCDSEVNPKIDSERTFKNFESAYKTLLMPSSVTARVLNFGTDLHSTTSSEEEEGIAPENSTPKEENISPPETVEVENDGEDESDKDNSEFQKPRKFKKFKTNFMKLLECKATASIPLSNKYDSLSESEAEPEQNTVTAPTNKGKATPNFPIKGNSTKSSIIIDKTAPKINKMSSIPPIVVEGRTDNHASLTSDLQAIIKRK
ncbi:unnamed protein product [Psylliodes chrysocephalus]|uniref:Uncharacterized protein n=1 Tax=Psylliodes chrysocephalus TaxID=3402493 RepID=A0A9P0DBL3_9CUCU|nr:unnamed protein product [Psylliodes chrysocephala]